MSVWFVSRHPGAVAWAKKQGLAIDHWVTHLDVEQVRRGDTVIGILPMPAAAAVCAKSARYFALKMNLTENLRGKELTEGELDALNCSLQEYVVHPVT